MANDEVVAEAQQFLNYAKFAGEVARDSAVLVAQDQARYIAAEEKRLRDAVNS